MIFMDKKVIVNIGREFGSNGHRIGKKLAEDMNVPFYDSEIISRASKESGIKEELFKVVDEQQTNSFLYSLAMGAYSYASRISAAGTVSMADRLFLIQTDVIKKIAQEGSCVIVGRCANFILKDDPASINIFISSDIDERVKNVAERENIDDKKALDMINKIDKKRANYYNYYTNEKWGSRNTNHMIINSSILGIDGTVKLIQDFIKILHNK